VRPRDWRERALALAGLVALAAVAASCGRLSGEVAGTQPALSVDDHARVAERTADGGDHDNHGDHANANANGNGTAKAHGGQPGAPADGVSSAAPLRLGAAPEPVNVAAAPPPTTTPTSTPTTTSAPPAATTAPSPPGPAAARLNLYAETTAGKLAPTVGDIPLRVYVPNSDENTLSVIDPATFTVMGKIPTGQMPHHVTPSWDMQTLYVLNTAGNTIIPIDPRTAQPAAPIPVIDPYNLYFTPDGTTAIVVAERYKRLDLANPRTWEVVGSIPVPFAGVDHGDFSADGRYFYASCEFSGWLVKVDLVERRVVADRQIGSQPIDVKMSPDASLLYVADQARHGVIVVDPGDLREVAFLPTGRGTHGLYTSRDTTKLYASNRLGGSVSVIDFATNRVEATWAIPGGGSPDMGGVSPDGSQLWLSGRHHGEVYAFDTRSGQLITRIRTGAGAHGLALFPQPGRYSLGHTGVYR
jgi:YVTN family beta-propeller protein